MPKPALEIVGIPEFQLIILGDASSPNDEFFGRYIEAPYYFAYAMRR